MSRWTFAVCIFPCADAQGPTGADAPLAISFIQRRRCGIEPMETTSITFKVKYKLDDEYRDREFEQTGKRPKRRQTIEVDATELSPTARRKLLELPGGGSNESKSRALKIPNFKTRSRQSVAHVPDDGYGGSSFYLDDYPTITEVSLGTMSSGMLLTLDEPLSAETMDAALEQREKRSEEIQSEYQEALRDTAPRLIEAVEEEIGHDGDGIPLPAPVLEDSVLSDFEDMKFHGRLKELKSEAEAQNERRKEMRKRRKEEKRRRKQKERERRKAEKEEWIEEHGSEVLRDAYEEGYDCQRRYATERVRKEHHEDFYLDFDGTSEYKDRSCPSEKALRFAQETGGEVVWLTHPGTEAADEEAPRHFEHREAVQKRVRLGEHGRHYTLLREFA